MTRLATKYVQKELSRYIVPTGTYWDLKGYLKGFKCFTGENRIVTLWSDVSTTSWSLTGQVG